MLHPRETRARIGTARRGWVGALVLVAALLALGVIVGAGSLGAAAAPTSQCVTCHTDAAKLKALTPPDPPSEEEGEG
jgi:hypothetical protein